MLAGAAIAVTMPMGIPVVRIDISKSNFKPQTY
jgi:hypothetical protein